MNDVPHSDSIDVVPYGTAPIGSNEESDEGGEDGLVDWGAMFLADIFRSQKK